MNVWTKEPLKLISSLKSKLIIPELPTKVYTNQRLESLFQERKKGIIITAPGGFGKTTMVLLALKSERNNTHWYRLENDDTILPVFYANLIETLFKGIDKTALDCYHGLSSINNIFEEYHLLNAIICQDAWQYYSNSKDFHNLVLDDFHHVADNLIITETLRYFIINMPSTISIILMSRIEASIYTGQLSLRDDILLINQKDLTLNKEDTEGLLLKLFNLRLTALEMDSIYEYIEGWIAALFLISRTDHIRGYLLEAAQKNETNPFKYFFKEFLDDIDPTWLQALTEMSIFSDFTCEDVVDIFDVENACEILEWLRKSNIYIQVYSTNPVRYRFHTLFRKELESLLKLSKTDTEMNAILKKAAEYYLRNGDIRKGILYYLEAEEPDLAINIMATFGNQLFEQGEPEKIMYLVMDFPEALVASNPYLLFYRGLMLRTIDVNNAYQCYRTALVLFKKSNNMSYLMNSFGMILIMSFETNDFTYVNNIVSFIPTLKVFFAGAPRKKLIISGFINAIAKEQFKIANIYCQLIDRFEVNEPIWNYSYLIMKGILHYRTGKLLSAYNRLPLILNHPVGLSSDQWRFIGLVACHNTLWLNRDIEGALKIRDEFMELAEKYDSIFFRAFAYRLSAIIKFQTRDIIGALSDMEDASNAYLQYGSPILASAAMITKYLWETETVLAQSLLEKAKTEFTNIPIKNAGHGYYELCQGMMGAIYKASKDYTNAEIYLLAAYKTSKRKNAHQHQCAMSMHLADYYYRVNNDKLCYQFLKKWSTKSIQNNYVFFHEMDYKTLVSMCALAYEKGYYPEHMVRLVHMYFGSFHVKLMIENPFQVLRDPLKFINAFVKEQKAKPIIQVRLFGNFNIQVNECIITESDFKTKKISGILTYILSEPNKTITRELLASIFWPNSDAKSASTSLRVALCDVRKTLSRFGIGFKDEYALIVEDKNGFHIGKANHVKTDVSEFNRLYKQLKLQPLSTKASEPLMLQMLNLYTGDFLWGNYYYDDWISITREFYKSIFLEISQALADHYILNKSHDQAIEILHKHMLIDPLCEKGANLLVKAYKETGEKARCASFIRQFQKRFKLEIGAKASIDLY